VAKNILLTLLALVLLGVGLPLGAQTTTDWVCPDGFAGQQLNVFNWSTYIAENTIADFETLCGVRVTYDVYDSDGDMMSVIRQGNPGYDIVVPSDYAWPLMAEEGLLVPLDLTAIPNIGNLLPSLLDGLQAQEAVYALPYLLGTFGIGYHVERVGQEITSWAQFFDYDGPVVWIDDPRTMLSIALTYLGLDPNTTDPDEIETARQFLIDHSANVVAISADDGQEMLARGEVDMVVEYNGDIYQIMDECECDDFDYVIPIEGSGYSAGFVGIPIDGQNPALALVFLDYLLDPQVAADIANFTAYPTPNQAAIDAGLIDPEQLANPAIYPDEDELERLYFIEPKDADTEELFSFAWDEVKIRLAGR
jgi:spermidine/putrescine transport system substrate-binding protein